MLAAAALCCTPLGRCGPCGQTQSAQCPAGTHATSTRQPVCPPQQHSAAATCYSWKVCIRHTPMPMHCVQPCLHAPVPMQQHKQEREPMSPTLQTSETCCVTHRARQFAVELPAVAAGCCADGQADQVGLVVLDQVGHEELLCMHLQDTAGRGSTGSSRHVHVLQQTIVCKRCAGAHNVRYNLCVTGLVCL